MSHEFVNLECRTSTGTEELDHQLGAAPEREGLLVSPVKRLRKKLQVEVPQELGEQQAHFGVREAVVKMLANTVKHD